MSAITEKVDIFNVLAFGIVVIKYIINIMTVLGENNEAGVACVGRWSGLSN